MSQPLSEGKRLGRYKLTRRLATGGMAEVWLARATGIQGFAKDIVIKTILPHHADEPEFVRMFVNEALLAAGLNHPNIVQIFDLGRLGRSYFIAMEYIQGRSLRQIKRAHQQRKSRVPVWLVLRAALSVCDALDYAHDKTNDDGEPLGIVHRDVTPENIMISFAGLTKVLDFGIAKASAAGAGSTQVGKIKGKFAYLAPEQILGAGKPGELDGRCDIYATGVVLYELLAGVRPFRAGNEIAMLKLILHDDPPPLCKRAPSIPERLSDIVMKALAKDPDKRYQTALDLRIDLEEYLLGARIRRTERDAAKHMRELFRSELGGEPEVQTSGSSPSQVRDTDGKAGQRKGKSKKPAARVKATSGTHPKIGGTEPPAARADALRQALNGADEGDATLEPLAPEVDFTIDLSSVEVVAEDVLDEAAAEPAPRKVKPPPLPAEKKKKAGKEAAAVEERPTDRPAAKKKKKKAAPKEAARADAKPKGLSPWTAAASKGRRVIPKKETRSQADEEHPRFPTSDLVPPGPNGDVEKAAAGVAPSPAADPAETKPRPAARAATEADIETAASPATPSSQVGTEADKELSTGASGRGRTKPSAGVPSLEKTDADRKVSVVEALPDSAPDEPLTAPSSGSLDIVLPSPSTSGELPSPSTGDLPSPATSGELPSPSTSGGLPALALPEPSSAGAPLVEPDLPTPSGVTDDTGSAVGSGPEPSSKPHTTADHLTPWDILIQRTRTIDDGPADEATPDEAPPSDDEPPAEESTPGLAEDESEESPHAWDAFLERTRVGVEVKIPAADELVQPRKDVDAAPAAAPEQGKPARRKSRHNWDAVLRRSRAPEAPEADRTASAPARRDVFAPTRGLSVSAEVKAAAAFDEGLRLLRKGDREGALAAWEEATRLHPDDRRYRANLRMLRKMIEGAPK